MEDSYLDPNINELDKGARKRRQIILNTLELISKSGIENITFEKIANTLRTTKSHVSYYYPDKNKLFFECMIYCQKHYSLFVQHALERYNGQDSLDVYIKASFTWAKQNTSLRNYIILSQFYSVINPEFTEIKNKFDSEESIFIENILLSMGIKTYEGLSLTIHKVLLAWQIDNDLENTLSYARKNILSLLP